MKLPRLPLLLGRLSVSISKMAKSGLGKQFRNGHEHHQNLYHCCRRRFRSSSWALATAIRAASSAAAFSRAFFSCNIFMPWTAIAMPLASSRRLWSHQKYIPDADRVNATTAQLAVVSTEEIPAISSVLWDQRIQSRPAPFRMNLNPPTAPPEPIPTSKESLAQGA